MILDIFPDLCMSSYICLDPSPSGYYRQLRFYPSFRRHRHNLLLQKSFKKFTSTLLDTCDQNLKSTHFPNKLYMCIIATYPFDINYAKTHIHIGLLCPKYPLSIQELISKVFSKTSILNKRAALNNVAACLAARFDRASSIEPNSRKASLAKMAPIAKEFDSLSSALYKRPNPIYLRYLRKKKN